MPIPSAIRDIFYTESLPSLGPEKRPDALSLDSCQGKTRNALESSPTQQPGLVQSALLLWHDHLDESHRISQGIDNSDGCFLHGIMHRREPDYPNSKYWFNRTRKHPSFKEISTRSLDFLRGTGLAKLTAAHWDPFTVIDEVSRSKRHSKNYVLLQNIQRIEFEVLLERFCNQPA